MKKYRITKKFTAWTVLLVLLVTLLASATVYAQGDPPEAQGPETAGETQLAGQAQTGGVITTFDKLDKNVAAQEYNAGTVTEEDLELPATLAATDETGSPVTIKGVTWEPGKKFDGDMAGKYVYTAILPDGYALAENVVAPTITVTVKEAETVIMAQSVEIGTPGDITPAPASTGTVYFGVDGYNSNAPILWRVVENGSGSMTLFADSFVTTDAGAGRVYNTILDHANWSGSDVCAWLNGTGSYTATGFLPMGFSAAEQSAITNYGTTETTNGHSGISIAQKIVLPSYEEMGDGTGTGTWGLTQADRVTSDLWWLRSPGGIDYAAAFVDFKGYVSPADFIGLGNVNHNYAIRPAFKLNLNSVLFTSAAVGGKSGAASAILSAVEPPAGDQKLTVFDTVNLQLTSVTPTAINGDTITFDYSGATAGETLSAIVTDASGDVTYYGKLATGISASDTGVQVTLPDGFDAATDTLEIFVEDINGDKLTDYASTPVALAVTAQTAPTAPAGGINQITGLTTAMEYRLTSASTWTAATDVTATGLAAGSYKVRYASKFESGTVYPPSPAKTVRVVVPSVTSVTVSPATASVEVGDTQQFTATVTVQNGASQTVTWSVDGTDSNVVNGLLTVGANETATALTITATSTFDGTKKGTAAVTVLRPVTGITVTGGGSDSPETGDESNLNIWIALMMVAGMTIFELIVYRRRKAQENR